MDRLALRPIANATSLAALFGLAAGYFLGGGEISGVVVGGIIGLVIGAGMSSFEIIWTMGLLGRGVREAPFLVVVLIKSTAWITILLLGISLPLILLTDQSLAEVLDRGFAISAVGGFIAAAFMNLVFQIDALLGRGVLLKFVTGRYHRPREEDRIFLFLDLKSSTAITEEIGNLRFHSFLRRFISDVTAPVLRSGGEIYRYVGDEIIVTWTRKKGLRGAACLRCHSAMLREIERKESEYLGTFGFVPDFWAGMHMGRVVSGEIGASKQEIVYVGDTMNTTARIEQACRTYQKPFLLSGALLSCLDLPEGWIAENLGSVELRGVGEKIELFALTDGDERVSGQNPSS